MECADEAQYSAAQQVLNELSNTRALTADKVVRAYPIYKAREGEIRQLFSLVAQNGVKGLLSMQGASLLANIVRR